MYIIRATVIISVASLTKWERKREVESFVLCICIWGDSLQRSCLYVNWRAFHSRAWTEAINGTRQCPSPPITHKHIHILSLPLLSLPSHQFFLFLLALVCRKIYPLIKPPFIQRILLKALGIFNKVFRGI